MREKIIKKAGGLFLKVGFKTITMDDIAREMGISKKTIYKHFENKELLIEATSEIMHVEVHQAMSGVLEKNHNAIAENFEIKNMLNKMFEDSATSPVYQLKKHYPEIYNQIISRETDHRNGCLRRNIEKGIAEGLYRKDVNIDNCIKFYYSIIFGIKEATILESEAQQLELEALEYHIRAMATPKGIEEFKKQLLIFINN
jgi:AcrR family transcriptional regulator